MTSRQVFEGMLIELNKTHAPTLLLEDFNYFLNTALNRYVNKRYNVYDTSQQTTDDLRVLKASAPLTPRMADEGNSDLYKVDGNLLNLYKATYQVELPTDYLHTLNCICAYKVHKQFKCYTPGSIIYFSAKRLSADLWGSIINNYYERPLYSRPYYYIHNINTSELLPTNPATGQLLGDPVNHNTGTDGGGMFSLPQFTYLQELRYNVYSKPSTGDIATTLGVNLTKDQVIALGKTDLYTTTATGGVTVTTIKIQDWTAGTADSTNLYKVEKANLSNIEKIGEVRYGNASTIRMEIRYGQDNSVFELVKVIVDYIKVPQYIRLTQEQMDLTEDTSQVMEFPDYVCQEIINELVTIVQENNGDPRLQTHIPISQSIAPPAQQSEQSHKK